MIRRTIDRRSGSRMLSRGSSLVRNAGDERPAGVTQVELSPKEWQILEELSKGATNPEIAEKMAVSVHTVKTRVKLILLKLGVANRTAAAAWFERYCSGKGLPAPEDPTSGGQAEPPARSRRAGPSKPSDGRRLRGAATPPITTALVRASGRDLCLVEVADSHVARAVGLLGRNELPMGRGIWIKPSISIHTFFLKFAIDVAYIDAEGTVVKTCAHLRPFRISIGGPRARSALELPSGFLELAQLQPGEKLTFSPPG